MTAADVLIVDDEPAMREMLDMGLRGAGFNVRAAADETEAKAAILEKLPDIMLLDWMLPGRAGVQFAQELRQTELTRMLPIILLTARVEERDRVHGLEVGADDFVTKPFSMAELIARIKAILRRTAPTRGTEQIEYKGLRIDPQSHRLFADERAMQLSSTEFRLLHFLMSHPDRVFNRTQIIDKVWGTQAFVSDRTVDVHVRSLRKSLMPSGHDKMIQTVRGEGYRFSERL